LTGLAGSRDRRWAGLGATWQQIELLRQVDVAIADLPDGSLGFTAGSTIRIDPDAAGYGWFIDPTPWDDLEFGPGAPSVVGVDMLTVLVHEMGHALGFEHSESPGDVMEPELAPGVRRIERVDGNGPATKTTNVQPTALASILVDARGIWDNRKIEVRSMEPELPEGRLFWVGFTPTQADEAAQLPESVYLANGKWTDRPEADWSLLGDEWNFLDGN
jgi:Matrixin